jgi:Zn-dependent peptidase ImmA (M78 family)
MGMVKKKQKISDASIVPANGRPEEVKVGYKTIKIKYVNPNFIMDDMTESYGEYRAREGVIYIQDSLVGQERCNTTWHEILHAVVYIAGLNQANGPLKEDDAEELVVNQISNFMMGVYRDNSWLLDMLKKHLDDIDN